MRRVTSTVKTHSTPRKASVEKEAMKLASPILERQYMCCANSSRVVQTCSRQSRYICSSAIVTNRLGTRLEPKVEQ